MAVTIENMDNPKSCKECPILYDYLYCAITETKCDNPEIKLNNCPLHDINRQKENN